MKLFYLLFLTSLISYRLAALLQDQKLDIHGKLKNVRDSEKVRCANHRKGSTEEDVEVEEEVEETDDRNNVPGEINGEVKDQLNGESMDEADSEGGDKDSDDGGDDLIDGVFAVDTINDSLDGDEDVADVTEKSASAVATTNAADASNISSELLNLNWENVEYVFDDSVLCKGAPLEASCTFCGDKDHVVDYCTAEQVTRTLQPLPPMPGWFKDVLTKLCYCCKGTVAF